jgi:hypothetical protein
MVEGSGMGGGEVGVNIGGEIDDATSAVTGIGDSTCPIKLVGVADETNTMRAVVA